MNKKEGFISYVLVSDVSDNSQLYYYAGYFQDSPIGALPVNTTDFVRAMKIPFEDEAEMICAELNKNAKSFRYHVEEHGYSN